MPIPNDRVDSLSRHASDALIRELASDLLEARRLMDIAATEATQPRKLFRMTIWKGEYLLVGLDEADVHDRVPEILMGHYCIEEMVQATDTAEETFHP